MRWAAKPASLGEIRAFVESSCRESGAADAHCFDLKVAVDEVCTNIIEHGYTGKEPGPIDVDLCFDSQQTTITICDEAAAFDPGSVAPPDLESDWDERVVGGLGWHLVRRLVDEVRHETREGGGNIVTLVKRIKRHPEPA